MSSINFQQLIDLAIGSPEPGHVNFYALHCVLVSFAEKLNIISEPVDCSKFGNFSTLMTCGRHSNEFYSKSKTSIVSKQRMPGGADDPEGENATAAGGAPEETEPNADAAPAPDEAEAAAEPAEAVPNAAEARASEKKGEPVEEAFAPAAVAVDAEAEDQQAGTETAAVKTETQQSLSGSQREKTGSAEVLRTSIENLEKRLSQIESATEMPPVFSVEYVRGISVMKDQLELAMDQLLKLTALTIDKKTSPQTYEQLRGMNEKLRTIQKHNVYIEGSSFYRLAEERTSAHSELGEEEELIEDGMEINSQLSLKEIDGDGAPSGQPDDQYQLDLHLCYTPEKMLDQMLQMKAEFCSLTNKVNEISATILEQDCQRTTLILQELQDAMRDVKYTTANLREAHERVDVRLTRNIENIDEMTKGLTELAREKIDRSEIEVLLADKVDYNQLQRKVSHEQMQELRCQFEKEFCEMERIIRHNEKNLLQAMANLQSTIGLDTFNELLNRYKEDAAAEVRKVDEKLQKYINATNDDCAAAGARVKVLQDLACLSCDTTCVMRTVEKAQVAKLPDAHATNLLAPLITYELGNIRKSGIMGYHRKDEFPHAPHAWMNRQAVNIKACVPRHAGGQHTTYTAKERVEKVTLNKK